MTNVSSTAQAVVCDLSRALLCSYSVFDSSDAGGTCPLRKVEELPLPVSRRSCRFTIPDSCRDSR